MKNIKKDNLKNFSATLFSTTFSLITSYVGSNIIADDSNSSSFLKIIYVGLIFIVGYGISLGLFYCAFYIINDLLVTKSKRLSPSEQKELISRFSTEVLTDTNDFINFNNELKNKNDQEKIIVILKTIHMIEKDIGIIENMYENETNCISSENNIFGINEFEIRKVTEIIQNTFNIIKNNVNLLYKNDEFAFHSNIIKTIDERLCSIQK